MSSRSRRRLALTAVLATALVTLTGCFKVAMNLDLKADDTVDGSIVFAIDKQYESMLGGQSLADAGGISPSDLQSLGATVTTKPYDDGSFVGQEIDFTGASLTQFSDSMNSDGSSSGDTFTITHQDGKFAFDATMDMSSTLADQTGGDPASTAMLQGLLGNASFTVSITFPGTVTDTNGTLDGNTVTWDLDLTGKNTLHAVALDHPSSGMSLGIWLGVLGALLFLAGLAFLAYRNRGTTTTEPPATEPTEPPAPEPSPEGAVEEPEDKQAPPPPADYTRG